jgi:ABC-type multidrug transport system fused ATPase/permease subunit
MARPRQDKGCFKCGAQGLHWGKLPGTNSVFLLTADDKRHYCIAGQKPSPSPAPAQESAETTVLPSPSPTPQLESLNTTAKSLPAHEDTSSAGRELFKLIRPEITSFVIDAIESLAPRKQTIKHDITVTNGEAVHVIADATPNTAKLIRYIAAKQHVLIVGPAGSGKTYAAKQAAMAMFGKDEHGNASVNLSLAFTLTLD